MRLRDRDEHDSIAWMLDDLRSQDSRAPDLSRSIMGRLGYMRAGDHAVQKRTLARWAQRVAAFMLLGFACTFGWRIFLASSEIRRPAPLTVPQAVGNDVDVQRQRFNSLIRTFRSFSPTAPASENEAADPLQLPLDPLNLPDDVNRISNVPVRWV